MIDYEKLMEKRITEFSGNPSWINRAAYIAWIKDNGRPVGQSSYNTWYNCFIDSCYDIIEVGVAIAERESLLDDVSDEVTQFFDYNRGLAAVEQGRYSYIERADGKYDLYARPTGWTR